MDGIRRYVLERPNGTPNDPLRLGTVMLRVKLRIRALSGPFSVNGGDAVTRSTAIERFEHALRQAKIGEFVRVSDSKQRVIRAKPVQLKVSVLPTNGNWKVDRYFGYMHSQYGRLNILGATVCKTIGTTSTPSQHSDWPPLSNWKQAGFPGRESSAGGNAIDLAADKRTMKAMFYKAIDQAKELDVENVIHWPYDSNRPLIWNPEQGIHTYDIPPGGSDHKGHTHADFQPKRTGGTRC